MPFFFLLIAAIGHLQNGDDLRGQTRMLIFQSYIKPSSMLETLWKGFW